MLPRAGGANTFRLCTMDYTVEESEIRRVVEPIRGIRGLNFRLNQRTLQIDGAGDRQCAAVARCSDSGR